MSPIEFHGKCCLLISCNHKFIIFMLNDSLYVEYVPNIVSSLTHKHHLFLRLSPCLLIIDVNYIIFTVTSLLA